MTKTPVVLLAIVLASRVVHAQAPSTEGSADAALAEGRRLYDLREWDQAIVKFKEAYRLRADAPALYNIAQAYRLKGDCAEAASFYKTFKRNFPKEKAIAKVERFITEMETCAKAAPNVTSASTAEPPTGPPVNHPPSAEQRVGSSAASIAPIVEPPGLVPPPPPEDRRPSRLPTVGVVTGAIGLVALGLGVGFGRRASRIADDVQSLALTRGSWDDELKGLEKSGKRAELAGVTLMITGGVAVVAGSVMYFVGKRRATESSRVTFAPGNGGAVMTWAGEF